MLCGTKLVVGGLTVIAMLPGAHEGNPADINIGRWRHLLGFRASEGAGPPIKPNLHDLLRPEVLQGQELQRWRRRRSQAEARNGELDAMVRRRDAGSAGWRLEFPRFDTDNLRGALAFRADRSDRDRGGEDVLVQHLGLYDRQL